MIETGDEINTIRLHEGLAITDLAIEKRGQDLFIGLQETQDGMLLKDYYETSAKWKIETADGAISALSELTLPEKSLVVANITEAMENYISQVTAFYGGALAVNGFQIRDDGFYHKERITSGSGSSYRTTESYQIGLEIDSQVINGDLEASYLGGFPSYESIDNKNFNKSRALTSSDTQPETIRTLNTENSTFVTSANGSSSAGQSQVNYLDVNGFPSLDNFKGLCHIKWIIYTLCFKSATSHK